MVFAKPGDGRSRRRWGSLSAFVTVCAGLIALTLPAGAAASQQRVIILFKETLGVSSPVPVAVGGPFKVPTRGTYEEKSLKTTEEGPLVLFTATETWKFASITISDSVTGTLKFAEPAGIGTTFTGRGKVQVLGTTGALAGYKGEGQLFEGGIIKSLEPFEAPGAGLVSFNLNRQ